MPAFMAAVRIHPPQGIAAPVWLAHLARVGLVLERLGANAPPEPGLASSPHEPPFASTATALAAHG
jgi:hypothetical protein